MMLRSPNSLGECSVSFLNQGSQHPKPARTFLIEKEKKARPMLPHALSSLQQEKEPSEVSQGTAKTSNHAAQAQLELLEKLTSGREKGKSNLTVSQKRNIRRQKYLDQVSKRNDAPFFATIALFVILPPAVILGVAVATGYINFLP